MEMMVNMINDQNDYWEYGEQQMTILQVKK